MITNLFLPAIFMTVSSYLSSQSINYDEINQVTSILFQNSGSIIYSYDKLGNRISYQIIPQNNCTYLVENTNDDGLGSLRKAIDCASPGDTIHFASTLTNQFISLTSSKIVLNKNLVFKQASNQVIKIKALFSGSVFDITNGSTIYIENIHLFGGSDSQGRAIRNQGTLTLNNVNIFDYPLYQGMGSIFLNEGAVTILGNCNFKVQN